MERWRPQVDHRGALNKAGVTEQKIRQGKPEPAALELEVNVVPKISWPKKGVPLRVSKRWRRKSAPNFTACAPCVQLKLSAHWKRFSIFRLGSPPPHPCEYLLWLSVEP